MCTSQTLVGQGPPCTFDEVHEYSMSEIPDYQFLIRQAQDKAHEMINENSQAVMNGTVYTIPVVFHIIHLQGEGPGQGSNISQSRVMQSLADLNSEFMNSHQNGNDVGINFCLAQRDPDGNSVFDGNGNNITGIQRVNGTGVAGYESVGITRGPSGNEIEVKALSNWPNTDYLNIWVVHEVPGNVAGYAYFPGAPDELDGIVIESAVTGTNIESKAITHEAGHYFGLYHTFQGNGTSLPCITINNCEIDGDGICDTRTHLYLESPWFPCDESQYLSCDNGTYQYNVIENHMNYTENNCRDEFTPDQVTHMRAVLMTSRSPLMFSQGCSPGCTDVIADFSASKLVIEENETISFTNISVDAIYFTWEVNNELFNSNDLSYYFGERGFYNVCLTAANEVCSNRKCLTIKVTGSEACFSKSTECDLVKNGKFSDTNFQIKDVRTFFAFENYASRFNYVCDWQPKQGSPDLYFNENNGLTAAIMVGSAGNKEGLVTTDKLHFVSGRIYWIQVKYLNVSLDPSGSRISNLDIGLANTNEEYLNNTDILLEKFVLDQNVILTTGTIWEEFNFEEEDFITKSICFSPLEDIDKHLYIYNNSLPGLDRLLINEVSVTCKGQSCTPIPDFTFDTLCPKQFIATNEGDGDEYIWNFGCNGVTMNGQNITLDLPSGECEVCLTAICQQEVSATICKTVNIPASEECQQACEDLSVELQACEQDTSQENQFMAQIVLNVPDGTGPCPNTSIISGSTMMDIFLSSISIADDPNDPSMDIISLGIDVTTPQGFDLLASEVAGTINLCTPDGDVICYNLYFSASQCENCLGEINATATCVDTDPSDGIYEYQGSVTVPLDPGTYSLCDPISTEAGYNQNVTFGNNEATIDFTINTSTSESFNTSTLVCILINGEQYCFTLNISVETCERPSCIEWEGKVSQASSCTIVDGSPTYTISMNNVWLFGYGFNNCGLSTVATMAGSNGVVLNNSSFSSSGGHLNFSATITMPCGFDPMQLYQLVIYGCDEEGNQVCFSFNIKFPSCTLECSEGGGTDFRESDKDLNDNPSILVYPNPSNHILSISIEESVRDSLFDLSIYDMMGNQVYHNTMNEHIEVNVNDYPPGLYLVNVNNQKGESLYLEKVIIVK